MLINREDESNDAEFVHNSAASEMQALPALEKKGLREEELQEARVAFAQINSEVQYEGRGLIVKLWSFLGPITGIAGVVSLFTPQTEYAYVLLFAYASSVKLESLAREVADLKTARRLENITGDWLIPLMEAKKWESRRSRTLVKAGLLKVFPLLQRPEFDALGAVKQDALWDAIRPVNGKTDPELLLATITLFRRMKAVGSLPRLEALQEDILQRKVRLKTGHRKMIEAELERALEAIAEVRDEESATSTPAIGGIQSYTAVKDEEELTQRERDMVETLLAELQEESKKYSRPDVRIGFLIATWCIIVPFCTFKTFQLLMERQWLPGIAAGFLTWLAVGLHRRSLSPKQSEMAQRLARYGTKRVVGPLIEALDWPDEQIRRTAAQALIELFPTLKMSDASSISSRQREILYRQLKMSSAGSREPFLHALLKALEQIGDLDALASVEKLSRARAVTAAQKRIRQRAVECLPFLSEQAQRNTESGVLLRASSSDDLSAEDLLRPVDTHGDSQPEQMLRPSTQPNE